LFNQNEIIINGIEMRNDDYQKMKIPGEFSPNIFIDVERIHFKDIFTKFYIYQSDEFNRIVKIFETFGVVKRELAETFSIDFITSCISLKPIPKHCALALELRATIINEKIISVKKIEKIDIVEGVSLISEIVKNIFESYCDRYREALEVNMAFYAEQLYP
jgi:hypothetical protein